MLAGLDGLHVNINLFPKGLQRIEQKENYSGKKKRHTSKVLVISDDDRSIKVINLSEDVIIKKPKKKPRHCIHFPWKKSLHMPTVLSNYLPSQSKFRFPKSFVAPASQGGMLEYKKLYNGLRWLCEEAGVTKVSPHSCTEIWFRSGATLEDVHTTDDRLAAIGRLIVVNI